VGFVSWFVMLSPARHLLEHSDSARRIITLRFRDGRSLRCRINDMAAFVEVYLLGDYEVPGVAIESAATIIDVGANFGAATVWFATRAPQARIISIEPGAAARELLDSNLVRNGLTDRVQVMAVALGSERRRAQFEEAEMSIQSHLVKGATEGPGNVAVIRLDDVFREAGIERADIVKIDCEGGEYDILPDASDDVLARIGCIAGEYHPSEGAQPEAIVRRLEAGGFAVDVRRHPTLEGFGNFFATRPAIAAEPAHAAAPKSAATTA
jgi:FkbM family methyltransferase